MDPVFPGAIASFGHSGTVQPHDPRAFVIKNGSFPVFVKVNSQVPSPPFLMVP
jgi:hypothetical protein